MIKAIIFDNGGVIVEDTWPEFIAKTSRDLGISQEELLDKLRDISLKVLKGELPPADFDRRLIEITGAEQGVAEMNRQVPVHEEVADWILALKSDGFKLVLLTNDFGDFRKYNQEWKLDRFFGESIYCSSELGMAKPHPEIFEYVLEKLELQPNEVVFIDDKMRNTDAASGLGMNVIQFRSLVQAKRELSEILERENAKK